MLKLHREMLATLGEGVSLTSRELSAGRASVLLFLWPVSGLTRLRQSRTVSDWL